MLPRLEQPTFAECEEYAGQLQQQHSILLLEADPALADLEMELLRPSGYHVQHVPTATQARQVLVREPVSLLVLDLRLPDEDGLVLLASMRRVLARSETRGLVCTRHAAPFERDRALLLGADDFLPKPFNADEFVWRVALACQSQTLLEPPADGAPDRPTAANPSVWLDHGGRCLRTATITVPLTPVQYRLLSALFAASECLVSCEALTQAIWPSMTLADPDAVGAHVRRLRVRLRAAGLPPHLISAQPGHGYRLILSAMTPI